MMIHHNRPKRMVASVPLCMPALGNVCCTRPMRFPKQACETHVLLLQR